MKYTIRELTPNTNITFFRPTAEGLLGEQSLGDDKETESFYTIVSDDFGTFNKFKTFFIDLLCSFFLFGGVVWGRWARSPQN